MLVTLFQNCGICGEGSTEVSTATIPDVSFTPITSADLSNGSLSIELGFRSDRGTSIEFRLCPVTDNSTNDFQMCRDVPPLMIETDAGRQTVTGTQFYPGSDQDQARLTLQLSDQAKCDRCVIQAKYKPGKIRLLIFMTPNNHKKILRPCSYWILHGNWAIFIISQFIIIQYDRSFIHTVEKYKHCLVF